MKTSYTPTFKAQVVQELLKGTKTIGQLAAEHGVHPNVLREWRTTTLHGLPGLVAKGDSLEAIRTACEQQIEERDAQIGRLTTQVAWLNKKAGFDPDQGRTDGAGGPPRRCVAAERAGRPVERESAQPVLFRIPQSSIEAFERQARDTKRSARVGAIACARIAAKRTQITLSRSVERNYGEDQRSYGVRPNELTVSVV